jgi:hypothetical protein
MVIRLLASSTNTRRNKSNAKFIVTPHRRSTVLVEYSTQRFHRELGRTREPIRKKFSLNVQAPSISGRNQVMRAGERQNSTLLYTMLECNKNSAEDVSDERAIDAFSAAFVVRTSWKK